MYTYCTVLAALYEAGYVRLTSEKNDKEGRALESDNKIYKSGYKYVNTHIFCGKNIC